MRLSNAIFILAVSLLVSSCYSRPPSGIGWSYMVGDPILYEHPYTHYHWGEYAPYYRRQGSYTPTYERVNQTGVININARP